MWVVVSRKNALLKILATFPGDMSDAIRPVRQPIEGGGVFGLACRSPGPARSNREEAAHVHCGSGSWGGQRPSMEDC